MIQTTPNHLVAVLDSAVDAEPTLRLVREAVEHGDRPTLLVALGAADRTHIRDYAASEELSEGSAEATYVEAALSALRESVGDADVAAVASDQVVDGRAVLDSAVRADATTVAVPSHLARRRRWRRAIAATPVRVVVTPAA